MALLTSSGTFVISDHALGFVFVLLAGLFEAGAQLALKIGATTVPADPRAWGLFARLWGNASVGLGIVGFAIQAVLWTLALRFLDLSEAFPASSLTFVWVTLLSRGYLQEQVGVGRWMGLACIVCGVIVMGFN